MLINNITHESNHLSYLNIPAEQSQPFLRNVVDKPSVRAGFFIMEQLNLFNQSKEDVEIWKPIIGFPEYAISNYSNIKSLSRIITTKSGVDKFHKGRIMKKMLSNHGYYVIELMKKGKRLRITIHRLVAITFIPNPFNLPWINHKNGIKTDNNIENLEWCTPSQNCQHAYTTGLHVAYQNQMVIDLTSGFCYDTIRKFAVAKNYSHSTAKKYLKLGLFKDYIKV